MSDALRSKEQRERFTLFRERIALLPTINEQIAQKIIERIPNPDLNLYMLLIKKIYIFKRSMFESSVLTVHVLDWERGLCNCTESTFSILCTLKVEQWYTLSLLMLQFGPTSLLLFSTMGSWQLYWQTATAVYICTLYSRQSSYTDREKSSQLITTGGTFASIRKYLLWSDLFFRFKGSKF